MNVQTQTNLDAITGGLKLKDPLDISAVEGLQEELSRYVDQTTDLKLDLSGIETCDTAGLQLLCSLRSSAASLGKSLRIVVVSEPFTSLTEVLGVSIESLEVPVAGTPDQGERNGI